MGSVPRGTSPPDATVPAKRGINRELLGVMILLVVLYSTNDKIVFALLGAASLGDSAVTRVAVGLADVAILGLAAALKRAIGRSDGTPDRLWRWWCAAAAVVVAVDVVRAALGERTTPAVELACSACFLLAMAIVMMTTLNAHPMTWFSAQARATMPNDWQRAGATAPLIVGSIAAYVGAALWADYFNPLAVRSLDPALAAEVAQMAPVEQLITMEQLCDEGINPSYFQHIAEVIPVLLLALGLEFNYFRQAVREPVQRAVMVITVSVMCTALVLALSTLPWDGAGCSDVLQPWHEYLAFTVSLQAIFMALTTVLWMLLASLSSDDELPRLDSNQEPFG